MNLLLHILLYFFAIIGVVSCFVYVGFYWICKMEEQDESINYDANNYM